MEHPRAGKAVLHDTMDDFLVKRNLLALGGTEAEQKASEKAAYKAAQTLDVAIRNFDAIQIAELNNHSLQFCLAQQLTRATVSPLKHQLNSVERRSLLDEHYWDSKSALDRALESASGWSKRSREALRAEERLEAKYATRAFLMTLPSAISNVEGAWTVFENSDTDAYGKRAIGERAIKHCRFVDWVRNREAALRHELDCSTAAHTAQGYAELDQALEESSTPTRSRIEDPNLRPWSEKNPAYRLAACINTYEAWLRTVSRSAASAA